VIAAVWRGQTPQLLESPFAISTLIAMAVLIFIMMKFPLSNAGSPDEPAQPSEARQYPSKRRIWTAGCPIVARFLRKVGFHPSTRQVHRRSRVRSSQA